MRTALIYMERTETAVRKLFEGIASYAEILQPVLGATFVSGQVDPATQLIEHEARLRENAAATAASRAAQREYWEQSFAMASLCGSVLQVAAKAIECYSENKHVSRRWLCVVGSGKASEKIARFCTGRQVRGVPIGLVIYAGRNQHTHYNEEKLSTVNQYVFKQLAVVPDAPHLSYSAFDLDNRLLDSMASNITYILGWRSYEAYADDMRVLLEIDLRR